MEQQIEHGLWLEIDGPCGVDVIPSDLVAGHWVWAIGDTHTPPAEDASEDDKDAWALMCESVSDYTENRKIWSIHYRKGYGARLSAPGYMDCTLWSVFDTEDEAREYLRDQYGDDESDDDGAVGGETDE